MVQNEHTIGDGGKNKIQKKRKRTRGVQHLELIKDKIISEI